MASAVGKPLQVDLATRNQTRPSCAHVKVEVDVLKEFPKRINMGLWKTTGEIVEKWINISYDHLPKYCKTCKLQGHDEQGCYVLHPELYQKKEETDVRQDKAAGEKEGEKLESKQQGEKD